MVMMTNHTNIYMYSAHEKKLCVLYFYVKSTEPI